MKSIRDTRWRPLASYEVIDTQRAVCGAKLLSYLVGWPADPARLRTRCAVAEAEVASGVGRSAHSAEGASACCNTFWTAASCKTGGYQRHDWAAERRADAIFCPCFDVREGKPQRTVIPKHSST
jgi:hypothetical protein